MNDRSHQVPQQLNTKKTSHNDEQLTFL